MWSVFFCVKQICLSVTNICSQKPDIRFDKKKHLILQSHGDELIKDNLFSTFLCVSGSKIYLTGRIFLLPWDFSSGAAATEFWKTGRRMLCYVAFFSPRNGETKRLSNVLDDDCWQHRCWFFTVATGNWQLATPGATFQTLYRGKQSGV